MNVHKYSITMFILSQLNHKCKGLRDKKARNSLFFTHPFVFDCFFKGPRCFDFQGAKRQASSRAFSGGHGGCARTVKQHKAPSKKAFKIQKEETSPSNARATSPLHVKNDRILFSEMQAFSRKKRKFMKKASGTHSDKECLRTRRRRDRAR